MFFCQIVPGFLQGFLQILPGGIIFIRAGIGNCHYCNIQRDKTVLGFIVRHSLTSSHIHKSDYLRLLLIIEIMPQGLDIHGFNNCLFQGLGIIRLFA